MKDLEKIMKIVENMIDDFLQVRIFANHGDASYETMRVIDKLVAGMKQQLILYIVEKGDSEIASMLSQREGGIARFCSKLSSKLKLSPDKTQTEDVSLSREINSAISRYIADDLPQLLSADRIRQYILQDCGVVLSSRVSVAVVGLARVGKSSLINKIMLMLQHTRDIVPSRFAEVGVRGTMDTACYPVQLGRGIDLFDVPGLGDPNQDDETIINSYTNYDAILLVLRSRPMKYDCNVYKAIRKAGKPCIVVHNHLDEIDPEGEQEEKSLLDIRRYTAANILKESFKEIPEFILTDCKYCKGAKYLERVIKAYGEDPDEIMKLIGILEELSFRIDYIATRHLNRTLGTMLHEFAQQSTVRLQKVYLDMIGERVRRKIESGSKFVQGLFEQIADPGASPDTASTSQVSFSSQLFLIYQKHLITNFSHNLCLDLLLNNLVKNIFSRVINELFRSIQEYCSYYNLTETSPQQKEEAIVECAKILGVIHELDLEIDKYSENLFAKGIEDLIVFQKRSSAIKPPPDYNKILIDVINKVQLLVASLSRSRLRSMTPEQSIVFKMIKQMIANHVSALAAILNDRIKSPNGKVVEIIQRTLKDALEQLKCFKDLVSYWEGRTPTDDMEPFVEWPVEKRKVAREIGTWIFRSPYAIFISDVIFGKLTNKEWQFLKIANERSSQFLPIARESVRLLINITRDNKEIFRESYYSVLKKFYNLCLVKICNRFEVSQPLSMKDIEQKICEVALLSIGKYSEPRRIDSYTGTYIIDVELLTKLYEEYKDIVRSHESSLEITQPITMSPMMKSFMKFLNELGGMDLSLQMEMIMTQLRHNSIVILCDQVYVNKQFYIKIGGKDIQELIIKIGNIKSADTGFTRSIEANSGAVQCLRTHGMIFYNDTLYMTRARYENTQLSSTFDPRMRSPLTDLKRLFFNRIKSILQPSDEIRIMPLERLAPTQIQECEGTKLVLVENTGIVLAPEFYRELVEQVQESELNVQELVAAASSHVPPAVELTRQILEAFSKNDDEKIKELIERGADVNTVNPLTRESLLTMAIRREKVDVVKFLLQRGAKANDRDHIGLEALERAGKMRDPEKERQVKGIILGMNIEARLKERIVGQDHAVGAVANIMQRYYLRRQTGNKKTIGILMFAGPSGVGKTELASKTAEVLADIADFIEPFPIAKFKKFNMNKYCEGDEAALRFRWELEHHVLSNPRCLILLHGLEEAHEKVKLALLQIMDNPELDFSNVLVIMTTNLNKDDRTRDFPRQLLDLIGNNIIDFNPMNTELACLIAQKTIEEIETQLKSGNIKFVVSKRCYEWLAPHFFARYKKAPKLGMRHFKDRLSYIIRGAIASSREPIALSREPIVVNLNIIDNNFSITIQNSIGSITEKVILAQRFRIAGFNPDIPPSLSDAASSSRPAISSHSLQFP